MNKERGFVVIHSDGNKYYCNQDKYTTDINKAKDFNSYATAKKVAKKVNGIAREVFYS